MPVSDSNQIPSVLKLVGEAKPESILDIGLGWGLYGALFRIFLDGAQANISDRSAWQIRIDGVEIFPDYIGEIQRSVYNNILIGNIGELVNRIGDYDVIYLGDVIEHLKKEEGLTLLRSLLTKANRRLIISTPNGRYEQGAVHGNEFETHLSEWTPSDFLDFPHYEVYFNGKTIIAALSMNPIADHGRRWKLAQYKRFPRSAALKAWLKYRWRRFRVRSA